MAKIKDENKDVVWDNENVLIEEPLRDEIDETDDVLPKNDENTKDVLPNYESKEAEETEESEEIEEAEASAEEEETEEGEEGEETEVTEVEEETAEADEEAEEVEEAEETDESEETEEAEISAEEEEAEETEESEESEKVEASADEEDTEENTEEGEETEVTDEEEEAAEADEEAEEVEEAEETDESEETEEVEISAEEEETEEGEETEVTEATEAEEETAKADEEAEEVEEAEETEESEETDEVEASADEEDTEENTEEGDETEVTEAEEEAAEADEEAEEVEEAEETEESEETDEVEVSAEEEETEETEVTDEEEETAEADADKEAEDQNANFEQDVVHYNQISDLNMLEGIETLDDATQEINEFYTSEDAEEKETLPVENLQSDDEDVIDEQDEIVIDENEDVSGKENAIEDNEEIEQIIELNKLDSTEQALDLSEGEFTEQLQEEIENKDDEQDLNKIEGYSQECEHLDAKSSEEEELSQSEAEEEDEEAEDDIYDDISELNKLEGINNDILLGKQAEILPDKSKSVKIELNRAKSKVSLFRQYKLEYQQKNALAQKEKQKKKQKKIEKKRKNLARKRIGCFGVFVIFSLLIIVGCVYTVYDLVGKRLLSEPNEVELPNFIGLYSDDIIDDSQYSVFDFEIEQVFEEGMNAGMVLSQFPVAPRTVKENSRVILRVNTPPQLVEIPDLEGMDRSEVKDELQIYELSAFFKTVEDDTVPNNTVLYTEPGARASILQGSTVTVYVSRDPAISNVFVPGVVGQSVSQAIDTLNAAGLTYDLTGTASGTVLSQSPAAGAYVTLGASITLTTRSAVQTAPIVVSNSPTDGHAHDFVLVQPDIGGGYSMYTCRLCGMQSLG